ncbi:MULTISPECIES: hypothetical protein [Bacteroidota]|uniref:Uncharacterized protein n=3 Tax=Sphingobacteriaceae TaxID=84566 RepID=A0A081PHN8_9SPHI|nr:MULTISPECIES: hypothetical protein [Bacteroidota]KEQ30211.1 hypothetical protein N180_06685 [Pedobacter antarcticus 4BY]WGQ12850.1 hypothetical protein QG727_12520 [Sphingobacterium faecium]
MNLTYQKSRGTFIFLLIFPMFLQAQIPGVYKYHIPHKNKSLTNNLYRQGVLPKDAFPNKIIELDNKQFLVVQKSEKSVIRAFKILEEREEFYILCSEDVDICSCKSSSFIYYKPSYKLQRIEKAFSFSLKRNLIARLHQFNIPVPSNYEDLKFCELLKQLE